MSERAPDLAQARDGGVLAPVEMMFVLVLLLASLLFIGFLGRLHAAGVEIANTSQSAARAASLSGDSSLGAEAAADVVSGSSLAARCSTPPRTELAWTPSPQGTWQGGSVTVTVTCDIDQGELAGVWAPGTRTIRASDTQPIDRYQR